MTLGLEGQEKSAISSGIVLVVGSGAREHALAWKLSQSPSVKKIIVAPGNDGMPKQWERWPCNLTPSGFVNLAKKAHEEKVHLAVIGPDNALADGIADVFRRYDILTFGPSQGASQIESSKSFAKNVMAMAGVPTARFRIVNSTEEADYLLRTTDFFHKGSDVDCVVKADGLAFGKGVRICSSFADALSAVQDLLQISDAVVLEERLEGEELSWMAFCSGVDCALLEPARDYKRLLDQDQGPNTGGMGAISPVPGIGPETFEFVRERVFIPTLKELSQRGLEFSGVLYAGLMFNRKTGDIKVLEFNARFGDPETQVLMPRMQEDLFEWCEAVAKGELKRLPQRVAFGRDHAVYVVAAAEGYPQDPKTGDLVQLGKSDPIAGPYFFAGVKSDNLGLVTSGGRVLGALGRGEHLDQAVSNAYQQVKQVQFKGIHFRTDIGK